jgi:elongation factor P--(R)-beta-lysine ligase
MSQDPPNQLKRTSILRDRAFMMNKARSFFHERGLFEVDVPILSKRASVDAHIDLISARYGHKKEIYHLHTSPEYGMKRLLSEGVGSIYQLSHVFRDGEYGAQHNPEFMMAEWYQIGFSFEEMVEETFDFITLFLGPIPRRVVSYRDLFQEFLSIDIGKAGIEELKAKAEEVEAALYEGIEQEGKDGILARLLSEKIEPFLGQGEMVAVIHFPESQAALAKKKEIDGFHAAERFEVYYQGIELANGYHELTSAEEQQARFIEANLFREKLGKEAYPIDDLFLAALKKGLPECSGVAVGFDRLMMLRHKASTLKEVLPFDFASA